MKKLLSLTLALIMALSCFGATFCAQAYNANECVKITLKGTMYDSTVQQIMTKLNTKRQDNGLSVITLDKQLTAIAKQRVMETMVYATYDKNDDTLTDKYRPDGDTVDSMIPSSYGTTFHVYGYLTGTDADSVDSKTGVSEYISTSSYSGVKNMGFAVAEYKGTYVAYLIVTAGGTGESYTSNTDSSFSASVNMNVKYMKNASVFRKENDKYFRYALSTEFYGDGFYTGTFVIPNSQLTYSSSKPAILKVKSAIAYPKKNGKAVVYAKTKSGKQIAKCNYNASPFNSINVTLKSLKSKKKSTMTASWSKNIIDASGYQVQYSTNKKFKKGNKTVTVKGKKNNSKTIKKLKRKKVYYLRVRAYIDQGNGEKAYSNWSKTKKVKVK